MEQARFAGFTPDSQELVFVSPSSRNAVTNEGPFVAADEHVERWRLTDGSRVGFVRSRCENARVRGCPQSAETIVERKKFGQQAYTFLGDSLETVAIGTMGSAAIIFSPDGSFVIVVAQYRSFAWHMRQKQDLRLTGALRRIQGKQAPSSHPIVSYCQNPGGSKRGVVTGKWVEFPPGKVLSNPKLPPNGLYTAADPGFVLVRPFGRSARAAAVDLTTGNVIISAPSLAPPPRCVQRYTVVTMLRCIVGWLLFASAGWALDTVRVVQGGRSFAAYTSIPVMNRGFLFFITHNSAELDVYKPDGQLAFATVVQAPGGAVPALEDAAVDDQGRVAVAIAWSAAANSSQGGIVLLDTSGIQTGLISTGRYIPTHLCFGPDRTIWTSGWQHGAVKASEDSEDYSVIRHFNTQGQEIAGFVKRSSFPPGLSPGGPLGGRWGIRVAGEQVGAILFSGNSGKRMVWLELDSSGKETGRWTLPPGNTQGMAFTGNGLYAVNMNWDREKNSGQWELDRFDKEHAVWNALSKMEYSKGAPCNCGSLNGRRWR